VLGVAIPSAPSSALACVVGTGTSASCTEAALDNCLPGGGGFDGTVTFDCGGPSTIVLRGPKTIFLDTAIDGGGLITVDGDLELRPFFVSSGVNLALARITIAHGCSCDGEGGSAVMADGTLTVTGSTFSNNLAAGFVGGTVVSGQPTTVTNSVFSNNSGGAILYYGALTVNGSIFSENYNAPTIYGNGRPVTVANSTFVSNGPNEAVIDTSSAVGVLMVTGSTFSGNRSTGQDTGPAATIFASNGTLTIADSTFTDNSADYFGNGQAGTILNWGATVTIINSTFSGNGTQFLSSGPSGAIYNLFDRALITLENTIVADSGGSNCTGAITDGGHNLRWPSTDTSCVGAFGDPMLAALADNGGPTQTMALEPGSAAIDAGDNGICAAAPVGSLDQRGFVRPGHGHASCSIGAFEADAVPPVCGNGITEPTEECDDGASNGPRLPAAQPRAVSRRP